MVDFNNPDALLDILKRATDAIDAAEARADEAEARAEHANEVANQLLDFIERRTRESKDRIRELEAEAAEERRVRGAHSRSIAEGVRALDARVHLAEAQAQAMTTKALGAEARAQVAEVRLERLRAAFDDITSETAAPELRFAVH